MVKIDSGRLASEQKKQLLGTSQGYFDDKAGHTLQQSTNQSEVENRYRIFHSHPENRCDKCLFSTVKFIIKNPTISSVIIFLFLLCLVFVGPVTWYGKCLLLKRISSHSNRNPDECRFDNPLVFYSKNVHTIECQFGKKDTEDEYQRYDSLPMWNECKNIPYAERFDCFPESNGTWSDRFHCYLKGCCWSDSDHKTGSASIPHCFYPPSFESYEFINISVSDLGSFAYYELARESKYPNNIPVMKIDYIYRTEDILEVKIYDPIKPRYETPYPELPPLGKSKAKNTKYKVEIDKRKFGFRVVRKSNNKTIFDTMNVGGFIFSDQLLQISAKLPSKYLYGLGQQRNNFLLDINWKKITLFNHDQPPVDGSNLYGSHPFYLAMEKEGQSDGVLLLNSNAMDIILTPAPAITYRAIGGVLDFFFFLGPSPAEVIQQYTELVGRPFLPPYWSLGFHLSRFGYKTLNETIQVWNRTRHAGISFDTQWNDLDYMENGNDFTYNKKSYEGLPEFVDLLHKEGMHYIVLVDPGISAGELPGQYPPYDEGIAQSVFVTDSTGYRPLVGKVWNKKSTVFVDFFKPVTVYYWLQQLKKFHEVIPFDGAWIDMNDPSNFVDGSLQGCGNSSLESPPYVPAVAGGLLRHRTLCMSARHNAGSLNHYDVHNVYGLAEAIITSFSMQQIRGKRPFVISRSSFPGHGKYAGVWTGDINSTWDDMAHSISDILSFSLFGIPMAGADICGFNGNATVELCKRWSQLGAFYPFSRNHNSDLSSDQDPVAMGPEVARSASRSLELRYRLLPYLYTLFWHAHAHGDTVARPMFLEFPEDINTYSVNTQFMWGPALLIVPVLKENITKVMAYLPAGQWYNAYTSSSLNITTGMTVTLPDTFVPRESVPLLLRGGYVIPFQESDVTTTRSRLNHMMLVISLNEKNQAEGDFYWDDGDTLAHNDGEYNYIKFSAGNGRFCSEVVQWRYNTSLLVKSVLVMGVMAEVTQVFVNNTIYDTAQFRYDSTFKDLEIIALHLDIGVNFEITWK